MTLRAEPGQASWQLTGSKTHVLDAASAGMILVVARTASALSLFAVAADAEGVRRAPLPTHLYVKRCGLLTRIHPSQPKSLLI